MKVVYVFGGIIILKTAFYENEYSIVDLLSKSQFAMFYERHRPQARIVLWTNHHQSLTPSTPPPPPQGTRSSFDIIRGFTLDRVNHSTFCATTTDRKNS